MAFQDNSIFWVEVTKVRPNPYQPRRDFDPDRLNELAESIKQYGLLSPPIVTRIEIQKDDGGLSVEYELIAGERRLRASKIAGLLQIPVIIRSGPHDEKEKLELAIIENLQREDLNPIDRARAFRQLIDEFGFKHIQVAKKIGRSREYVSNSVRLLALPENIQLALIERKINEGHARPLLMLSDRPDEQASLFKETVYKKLTVRNTEAIARHIAQDKVRKKTYHVDPIIISLERKLADSLGTRVHIESRDVGGKIVIDFFSSDDIEGIVEMLSQYKMRGANDMLNQHIEAQNQQTNDPSTTLGTSNQPVSPLAHRGEQQTTENEEASPTSVDSPQMVSQNKDTDPDESELYSVNNFSI